MTNWNNVFWLVFIILGAIVIAGSMIHIIYIDIILGLLVVGVGAAKLAEEIAHRRMQFRHREMNESISYLTRQVDSAANTAEHLKGSSDSRFFKIDNMIRNIDDKLEDKYEDAVKKVISMENRLNDHSKMMLEIAKRQEAIKGRQAEIGERLRHMPRVSKPALIAVPARPATATAPVIAPEKRIMRFTLPKIAPRAKAKLKAKTRKRKTKPAVRTIINIQAPKPQVIKKIIKVKPKPSNRPKARRKIVTSGKTVINIQAPKPQIIRKVVRAKSKKAAKPKALKRKAPKKVRAKNISINIA